MLRDDLFITIMRRLSFGKTFVVFLMSLGTLTLLFHVNNSLRLRKWPPTATKTKKEQRRFDGLRMVVSTSLANGDELRETTIAYHNKDDTVSDNGNLSYTSSSMIAFIPNTGSCPDGDSNCNKTYNDASPENASLQSTYNDLYLTSRNATEKTETSVQLRLIPTLQPSAAVSSVTTSRSDSNDNLYSFLIPPLCTREEIRLGEWVPITMPEIPYFPYSTRCQRNKAFYDAEKPWNTWEWQPFATQAGNCTFLKWNASQFCSLTRHATIAIVGDSLSWEQYASLAQLLGQPVINKMQIQSLFYGKFVIHTVCQNRTRLVFFRDDTLERVALVLNTTSPNVLILNRGAHYTPDDVLEADLQRFVIPHVQAWQESCRASKRPCQWFVRTTVPGHANCGKFKGPVKSVREMETFIADLSNYLPHQLDYHWQDFQRQNLLSLRVYQHHQANNVTSFEVLDGYDINVLRPDDHVKPRNNHDCIHSCFPGKVDVYNQLLLHFLHTKGGVVVEDATAVDNWRTINQSKVVS